MPFIDICRSPLTILFTVCYLSYPVYHPQFAICHSYYDSIASIRLINSFPRAVLSSICFKTAVTKVLLSKSPRTCSKSCFISSWEPSAPNPVIEDNENSFLASSYTILSNPTTACCHAFTIPMISCAVIVSGFRP